MVGLFLTSFNFQPVRVEASHDCSAYQVIWYTPVTTTYGQPDLCRIVRNYNVYPCWYCFKEDYRTLVDTETYTTHEGSLYYSHCDRTYLQYRHICPKCGFLVASSQTICTNHPIHQN